MDWFDITTTEEIKVIVSLQIYEKTYDCYLAFCDREKMPPQDIESAVRFVNSFGFKIKITILGEYASGILYFKVLGKKLIVPLRLDTNSNYYDVVRGALNDAFFAIEYPLVFFHTISSEYYEYTD